MLVNRRLRKIALRCIVSIFQNFFFLQYKAALFSGSIPVSQVDHPLDELIPFTPRRIAVYLDFVAFWVRLIGFLLKTYKRSAEAVVLDFLESMGRLYGFAAEVYKENLSTTKRPFYIGRPRFAVIHIMDPHLMCIPSLHVMVVIHTYTKFKEILQNFGEAGKNASLIEKVRSGALAITEAVLYVKQHSVNCISAAMYAMTRFNAELFPDKEAALFVDALFIKSDAIGGEDAGKIRGHILSLYRRFADEGRSASSWKEPLLAFLRSFPKKRSAR
ncbi:MAG: hypothetical protein LBQ88_13440 [Treponema sp.]|nr:hypothetical protein [Treponema sp.]